MPCKCVVVVDGLLNELIVRAVASLELPYSNIWDVDTKININLVEWVIK